MSSLWPLDASILCENGICSSFTSSTKRDSRELSQSQFTLEPTKFQIKQITPPENTVWVCYHYFRNWGNWQRFLRETFCAETREATMGVREKPLQIKQIYRRVSCLWEKACLKVFIEVAKAHDRFSIYSVFTTLPSSLKDWRRVARRTGIFGGLVLPKYSRRVEAENMHSVIKN